jgi:hypothetical protein
VDILSFAFVVFKHGIRAIGIYEIPQRISDVLLKRLVLSKWNINDKVIGLMELIMIKHGTLP